jgi:hypothetical protein
MRRLEIVDLRQNREIVHVGLLGLATGETTSSMIVRPVGSERLFAVRIPAEMYEDLASELDDGEPPQPEGRGRSFEDFEAMLDATAEHARTTRHQVVSADNPTLRYFGFADVVDTGVFFCAGMRAVKGIRSEKIREHAATPAGRRRLAACLSHGHGPGQWADCGQCATVLDDL